MLISIFLIVAIRALATKLVEQWLKTVKGGEQVVPMHISEIQQIITDSQLETKLEDLKNDASDNEKDLDDRDSSNLENNNKVEVDEETLETPCKIDITDKDEQSMETEVLPVLKITLKNGKQILSQVEDDSKSSEDSVDKDNNKEKQKSRSKDKSEKSSSSSSSKSSSSKHSSRSSSSDKRSNHKESSSKHSSKDKSRDKDKRTSHSSRSKSSSSSSSSSRRSSSSSSKLKDEKSSKDKSKDKDSKQSSEKSDDKVQTAISKLGKIPKLSDVKKEKLSISIEVRKPDEPKPKTVKTFNSKFRKHGLEEEMKPPPSRATLLSNKKPPPALPPTVSIPKRPSPVHNDTPPEKKPKPSIDLEKPGSIKLIPPKPKREYYFLNLLPTTLLTHSVFTGNNVHQDLLFIVLQHIFKYIGCNIKCGKSKMHNLTGLIIHVLKSYVKYLFIMKIKVKILITIF